MLFQETQLDDDGMTNDSHSCGTTNTTIAASSSSSYDYNNVKVYYENKKKNISTKHKNHFLLLCESCFWCASSIYTDSNNNNIMNRMCPVCNNIKVESISIQNNEKKYKFDYIKDLQLS
jgi:hypothetical protein